MNAKDLSRQAMDSAGGDVLKATDILYRQAETDKEVWMELTRHLLKTACYDACRSICQQERRAIWYSPNYSEGGNGDRVREHSKTLMDWPLPGGKLLRNATKDDLIDAASFYRAQAKQMAAVSDWLNAIASRIKSKKTVGESLTDDALEKLKNGDIATIKKAA